MDSPSTYLNADRAIAVDIKDSENLFQILFQCAARHDVEHAHELPEIDISIL